MILLLFAFTFVVGVIVRLYLFFIEVKDDIRLTGRVVMSTKTNETHSLWGWRNRAKPEKKFDLALSDSNGFFNEIANDDWEKMKHDTMMAIDLQFGVIHRTSDLLSESGANINTNVWWTDNWKVSICTDHIHSYFVRDI